MACGDQTGCVMGDTTEAVQRLPERTLLLAALAAIQWARLAAWLLELHEGKSGPRIALERAELLTDLAPAAVAITGELEHLDALRAQWRASDGPESARLIALDAVRRALHGALDCLDHQAEEREAGIREVLQLTLRAWRLYGGLRDPVMVGAVESSATVLSPVVLMAALRASEAP